MHTNGFRSSQLPEYKDEISPSDVGSKNLKKRFVSSSVQCGLKRFGVFPFTTFFAALACSGGVLCCACGLLNCVICHSKGEKAAKKLGVKACLFGKAVAEVPFIIPSRADHFASLISKMLIEYIDHFSKGWGAELDLKFKEKISKQIKKNIYNIINNNTLDSVYVEELVNTDIEDIVWNLKQIFIYVMRDKKDFNIKVSVAASMNEVFSKNIDNYESVKNKYNDVKIKKIEDIISSVLSFDFFKMAFEKISSKFSEKAAVNVMNKSEYDELNDLVSKDVNEKFLSQIALL